MSSKLVAFLRARLDEDEKAARAAASVCGCHPEAPAWSFGDETTDGRIVLVDDPHPETRRKIGRRWNGSYEGLFMAQHIARHDPARVLREVEAKWAIVQVHGGTAGESSMFCPHCEHDTPCPTLRLLAAVYADHPDYRQEWTP